MYVHTWWCICFIWLSGFDKNLKWLKIAFANEIKNGLEVKEKKEKRIRKQKTLRSCKKYIFENLSKFLTFIWVEKYTWNYVGIRFGSCFKIWVELRKENRKIFGKRNLRSPLSCPSYFSPLSPVQPSSQPACFFLLCPIFPSSPSFLIFPRPSSLLLPPLA